MDKTGSELSLQQLPPTSGVVPATVTQSLTMLSLEKPGSPPPPPSKAVLPYRFGKFCGVCWMVIGAITILMGAVGLFAGGGFGAFLLCLVVGAIIGLQGFGVFLKKKYALILIVVAGIIFVLITLLNVLLVIMGDAMLKPATIIVTVFYASVLGYFVKRADEFD